ncbi:Glycosyl hydrolases family 35 [Pseudobutyrivibrio sp. UC1225]|uniref:beta-galactosidase n=1 Tax=Pseudobutyrivibrio sp. UC1225 TaxID=1798185 RepID=UPI0008E65818|nr:beta-galactosidase [Pseudobutyrivibrio sp. UC1225]SFN91648.1 Glycosyl hydrolases family 35 [Pseudobutyrivibrio sp. UC1225]
MHIIDFTKARKQKVYPLSQKFFGKNPAGQELGFTNYYMTIDGEPFFAISGECHFTRVAESQWEDTILKMKAGGLNIVSTYVFWNHHEEIEGEFCFDGRRNLRKFVEICAKHDMFVILRIGPFCHGEVRNGGLPDWLYGKPYDVRSNNSAFLEQVRLLYRAIGEQIQGLLYKDGGPIIGAQLDNEYMHSAAPWEMTTGISNEWVNGGRDGDAYLVALKNIAIEEGIVTPFYTCTGWGGAATPTGEMLPLWGGYAFWPWMFYGNKDYKHPATPEYIYRDNHNNAVKSTYNFEPFYEPESMPYSCCEMGGGMIPFYNYRFHFPCESVDAMANVKLASGCNFLGYYMYRGGTNPHGLRMDYLNEHQVPKLGYDYNAPIGEFGQLRPSFYRLRCIHIFLKHFGHLLCPMTTILADDNQGLIPEDNSYLRYAARTDGESGFLFINNYQDHIEQADKVNESITIKLKDKEITIDDLSIAAGEEAILPINLDMDGVRLEYATAQLLSRVETDTSLIYIFFRPAGMKPVYKFEGEEIIEIPDSPSYSFGKQVKGKPLSIITLSRELSLEYTEIKPPAELTNQNKRVLTPKQCGESRFTIEIPKLNPEAKDTLLQINYSGDIGQLFDKTGKLLHDDFCCESTWEIGLKELGIKGGDVLTLYITPKKDDVVVDVSSTMAGRLEKADGVHYALRKVALVETLEG